MWQIKSYRAASGKNPVQARYDGGSDELQAALEVELAYLRCCTRDQWRRPRAARLSKCQAFRDFFEIRFRAGRVQQRPIGFFGPAINEFTLVLWATEKGGQLLPRDWCQQAERRHREILSGIAQAVRLRLNEEDDDDD